MATQSLTVHNNASFTTTAGTESAIAFIWIPTPYIGSVGLEAIVNFTAINAATTACTVKVRQGSYASSHIVTSSPAGTQVGATGAFTATAGTATTATVGSGGLDTAPTAWANLDQAVPAQVQSVGMPGVVDAGGFLYVLTVSSTTNTAVVAAGAAVFSAAW